MSRYTDSVLFPIIPKETEEEVCKYCGGSGEVSTDEMDNDSHELMRGVGTEKCICRLEIDKYSND